MLKIGSHVSMSGDDMFLGSVKEALSYKETAFMVYTGDHHEDHEESQGIELETALRQHLRHAMHAA